LNRFFTSLKTSWIFSTAFLHFYSFQCLTSEAILDISVENPTQKGDVFHARNINSKKKREENICMQKMLKNNATTTRILQSIWYCDWRPRGESRCMTKNAQNVEESLREFTDREINSSFSTHSINCMMFDYPPLLFYHMHLKIIHSIFSRDSQKKKELNKIFMQFFVAFTLCDASHIWTTHNKV
jgi:hypothetical protein